ncbi:hypothetical protein HYX05_02295 [Candidatus Woesearchaeota archaeon]|nr:hypothetical protein [Candidatus Woesearchaeota archaeon]
MDKTKKILAVFAIFLCLISFAYAKDFALFSGRFYEIKDGEQKIEFESYNGTYDICENEKKTIPIMVVNNASSDDKYSLSASGVGWLSFNLKEFSLPKNQSGIVFLELSPYANAKGSYYIDASAFSSEGIRQNLLLNINVNRCYSLSLELEKERDKACGGIKKQYSGEITNSGEQEISVELRIKGPNWISLDKNIMSVAANNHQNFSLNADVPANAKGIFNVIVNAAIKNLPSIKEEKRLSIEVVPKYDCYKAGVLAEDAVYLKNIDIVLKENKFWNEVKSFFVFYKFYLISGILISLFIIFLIEFYKPMFGLLKSIDRPKRKK